MKAGHQTKPPNDQSWAQIDRLCGWGFGFVRPVDNMETLVQVQPTLGRSHPQYPTSPKGPGAQSCYHWHHLIFQDPAVARLRDLNCDRPVGTAGKFRAPAPGAKIHPVGNELD